MRSKAKAVNFVLFMELVSLDWQKNVGTSWKEAKDYINTYFEKYKGIHEFMQNIVKEAKEKRICNYFI